jgi:ABC-2 type transport system ATP-binding protein
MVIVKDLRRSFGPIRAVDGISFTAEKGDVLGIVGPNGAGKSTAMKMLTCFLQPDSGTATICGHDIAREPVKVRQSLGYLAENSPLYDEMTVWSFLNFICDARQLRGHRRRDAIGRVTDRCAVGSVLHQTIGTLSKGYRRRVGLAQALIHDPDVLILDEPTDGLDPNQKHDVRRLITKMARKKCILVSTHILEEVEAVCTRVIVMAGGRILADSTPDKLKSSHDADLAAVFRQITLPRSA